jgi:thiamine-phosphate pyrophosphorylase
MAGRCLLYYITDRSQFRGDEDARRQKLLEKVTEAALAGVDYIQLRERDLSGRKLESLTRDVVATVRERSSSTRVLINSRLDVALAAGADGVHLRGDDVSACDIREVWKAAGQQRGRRSECLVAVSCHSEKEVMRAESEKADFVVYAPVFGKNRVPEIRPAGLEGLRQSCRAKIPVLALGGVSLQNAASCLDAGAAGVAGIRLFQENEVEAVVRSLRAL